MFKKITSPPIPSLHVGEGVRGLGGKWGEVNKTLFPKPETKGKLYVSIRPEALIADTEHRPQRQAKAEMAAVITLDAPHRAGSPVGYVVFA